MTAFQRFDVLLTHLSTPTSSQCGRCRSITTSLFFLLCSRWTRVSIPAAARGCCQLNMNRCCFGAFAGTRMPLFGTILLHIKPRYSRISVFSRMLKLSFRHEIKSKKHQLRINSAQSDTRRTNQSGVFR